MMWGINNHGFKMLKTNENKLSSQDLAKIYTRLVIPITIKDITFNNWDIDEDMTFSLHQFLSDMLPDAGILAIAASAQFIASKHAKELSIAGALGLEADKIMEDYGPDWLSNAENVEEGGHSDMLEAEQDKIYKMLIHLPEDLETLADLLETVEGCIMKTDQTGADLCHILSIQARAQMDIAEAFLEEVEKSLAESQVFTTQPLERPLEQPMEQFAENNVIPFRMHSAKE